jgi:hypothetical protein
MTSVAPCWTGVSQYGQTCHCCSSGLRQRRLAHVLEVLGRAQDRVDHRPDEREDQRGDDGDGDEDRVCDAPPRVLVRPEGERQPEHDDEEPTELEQRVEGARVEEVADAVERVAGGGCEKDHWRMHFRDENDDPYYRMSLPTM